MPRRVVPTRVSVLEDLANGVELLVQRQDQRCIVGDAQVLRRDVDPCPLSRSISSRSARGSITTPLPITDNFPGRTTPDGSSDSL